MLTSAATTSAGVTIISGTLESTPNQTFVIRLFSNPRGNEGKKVIGAKSVSTGAGGSVSSTFSPSRAVPAGQRITATATSAGGDTSEFSAPREVTAS